MNSKLPSVKDLLSCFSRITDPLLPRDLPTTSRLGILPSGKIQPVLELLARAKFGEAYDPELTTPIWSDGNWRNETWANVGLRPIGRRLINPELSQYKAGTPEYWTAYRRLHKDRVHAYQKQYRERRKATLAAMQLHDRLLSEDPISETDQQAVDEIVSSLLEEK